MRKTMKFSGLLWTLLFAAGTTSAAGLGRLSVQSALGQPLRAEIELLSVNKEELAGISAKLAGAEAFRQARIERSEVIGNLRFNVDQRVNGQPIIRVSSATPIADPFLDLLIEVNWTTGRVLREYTILLDPPADAKPAPTQPVAVPEVVRPPQQPVAAAEPKAMPEPVKPRPVAEPAPARQPRHYGPVRAGETLRGIAGKVKHDSVSLEQMMVGLYQANQDAFHADNMNRLKRGQVLNVPEAEAVQHHGSPNQAARTVQGHAAEWHAYRRKLADMAGEAPAAKMPEPAAGKVKPRTQEQAPPAAAAPKDVLKLSKAEPASGGRPDGKTQEKLHAMEEEMAAKSRALQEAQDRVGQLERTVRDMQKLLEMKTQQAGKPPAAAAPAPAPAPAPAAPVAAAPSPTPTPAVEPPPAPTPAAPPPPAAVKPKPAPAPVALPEPSQSGTSWITTFISNPLYIGGIVASILLSVLLWMMMVGSRRKQGLNKFEDSIMTGGEFKNNVVFNAGASASAAPASGPNTEGSMLLTDFSRLGLGAIDTHEVDPIAEAEVYMAYGRDAQAEEILKEALSKDPGRHEIALKLLEIYAARKDTMAYETVASELYAGLGGQGTPVWQRAAEMGRSIDPENPLYRTSGAASPAPAAAFAPKPAAAAAPLAMDFGGMDDWESPTSAPQSAAPARPPASSLAPTLPSDDDFDIPAAAANRYAPAPTPAPPPTPAPKPAPAPSHDDFLLEFESSKPAAPAAPAPAPAMDDFANDMDWDLPAPAAAPVAPPEPPAAPDFMAENLAPSPVFAPEPSEWQPDASLELPDLDFPAAPAPAEEAGEEVPVLDLSGIDLELETADAIPDFAREAPAPAPLPEVEEFAATDDFTPASDFIPEPAEAPAPAAAPAPVPEDVADPELWEEVNTKLDLARAYLEMGDKEGAREILQEVLGEGDAQQKADADRLLAEAG